MRKILALLLLLFITLASYSQAERKYLRQGNKEYEEEKFDESELLYRRALEKEQGSWIGEFNLGDALYKQEKYEDAARNFEKLADSEGDPMKLSQLYHNLGNSLLQSEQLEASIDAYKNALRQNPADEETRHNLAFAQKMLQQQQEQQQQQQQDQQDQDQDQQDQDQQDQQDQNQDQQQQDQQNQDQQQQDQQNQDQQDQQQSQPQQISREDAERMLQAMQEDEQELQEKLQKQKASAARVRVLKDW